MKISTIASLFLCSVLTPVHINASPVRPVQIQYEEIEELQWKCEDCTPEEQYVLLVQE